MKRTLFLAELGTSWDVLHAVRVQYPEHKYPWFILTIGRSDDVSRHCVFDFKQNAF